MKTTVQGYSFDITEPYAVGAKMGAIEAKALNQLRAENIGNNQRKAVAKLSSRSSRSSPSRVRTASPSSTTRASLCRRPRL